MRNAVRATPCWAPFPFIFSAHIATCDVWVVARERQRGELHLRRVDQVSSNDLGFIFHWQGGKPSATSRVFKPFSKMLRLHKISNVSSQIPRRGQKGRIPSIRERFCCFTSNHNSEYRRPPSSRGGLRSSPSLIEN